MLCFIKFLFSVQLYYFFLEKKIHLFFWFNIFYSYGGYRLTAQRPLYITTHDTLKDKVKCGLKGICPYALPCAHLNANPMVGVLKAHVLGKKNRLFASPIENQHEHRRCMEVEARGNNFWDCARSSRHQCDQVVVLEASRAERGIRRMRRHAIRRTRPRGARRTRPRGGWWGPLAVLEDPVVVF